MANDFDNVRFERRLREPSEMPTTLFTPFLPSVVNLKILVAPEYDDTGVQLEPNIGLLLEEETVSLQATMGLNGDTATFVKLILMFTDVAVEHLDFARSFLHQDIDSKVSYLAEVMRRFPKFDDYFVDAWPAFAFVKIYFDKLEERGERQQKQQLQTERIRSIVQSVCELMQPDRAQTTNEGRADV